MSSPFLVRIWGAFDIAYLVFVSLRDLVRSHFPFAREVSQNLQVAMEFGHMGLVLLNLAAIFLTISLLFSGYALLLGKRIGAYIALIQMPFRIFLVLVPSVFFLPTVLNQFVFPYAVTMAVIAIIETAKGYSLVIFLRRSKPLRAKLTESS